MMLSFAISLLFPLAAIALQPAVTAPLTHPTQVPCPTDRPLVRRAGARGHQSLSHQEAKYITTRTNDVLPSAWRDYLHIVKSTSPCPLPDYVSEILSSCGCGNCPNLGMALSGGGYRAALFSAGVLAAFDGRNETAAQRTGTGGLLQATLYLSAVSSSSWLTTALAQAGMPTIPDLIFPPSSQDVNSSAGTANGAYGGFLSQFDFLAPGGPDENATLAYLELLISEIASKRAAGLPVTITDVWSRTLARHFVNGTTAQDILSPGPHGVGYMLSDIAFVPSFASAKQPFPVMVVESFSPSPNLSELAPEALVPLTNEMFEINVFETGSWDPSLSAFIPTDLLGSTDSSHCVKGFDEAAFAIALSSNVFGDLNTSTAALASSQAGPIIALLNATFPGQDGIRLDSGAMPNPFRGVNPTTFSNTNESIIVMTDGTSDLQNMAIQPLLVQARDVDTIIAIDVGNNGPDGAQEHFSNGTGLIISAKRAALFGSEYQFPKIPATAEIFLAQNLTRRPTFFGCDETNGAPLMIYIANGGPPASGAPPVTNISTEQTTVPQAQVQAILDQSFEIVTQGKPSGSEVRDPEWGACLACAVVDRVRARARIPREGVCKTCMERYCWYEEEEECGEL